MRLDMAIEVHGDEAVELQEARIDVAHEARMRERHLGDDMAAEPLDAALFGQRVHDGRILARVDRPAHQRHRQRRVGIVRGFHAGDRRQHRHRRLAHRDHVGVAVQRMQHRDHVVDVVVEIEAPFGERHHAGVDPFGDVDVVIRQERLDRAAQQRRVVAGHRRDDQQLRLRPPRRRARARARNAAAGRTAAPRLGHDVHRDALAADHGGCDRPSRAGCSAAWCARTARTPPPRPCRRRCGRTDWRDSCRRCGPHRRRRAPASARHGPSRRTSTSAPTGTDCRRRAAQLPRRTRQLACGLAPARLFALQQGVVFSSSRQPGKTTAGLDFAGEACAQLMNYSPVCSSEPLRRAEASRARNAHGRRRKQHQH